MIFGVTIVGQTRNLCKPLSTTLHPLLCKCLCCITDKTSETLVMNSKITVSTEHVFAVFFTNTNCCYRNILFCFSLCLEIEFPSISQMHFFWEGNYTSHVAIYQLWQTRQSHCITEKEAYYRNLIQCFSGLLVCT